jgi:hypothetical protein
LQHAVFYPGTWLDAVLGVERGLPLRLLGECGFGAACAAALGRTLRFGAAASSLLGLLLVGVCLLGQSFWPPEVSSLAWIPWQWLCLERWLQRGGWGWWLGLAFGTALQLVAGFPQFALYGFYLLGAWTLLRLFEERARGAAWLARRAALAAAAVALGAGLAGVQLAPTLELVAQSRRSAPLSEHEAHYLFGMGDSLKTALANLVDPRPKSLSFDFRGGGGYLGVATLLLVALGVATAPAARALALAALSLLALLLSDGYSGVAGGLFRLYASLPGGDLFRTPERLRVVALLAWIALAGYGLEALRRGFPDLGRRRVSAALAAAGAVAGAIAWAGETGAAWRAALALALVAAVWLVADRPRLAGAGAAALVGFALWDLAAATRPDGSLRSLPMAWTRVYHSLGIAYDEATSKRLEREAGAARVAMPRAAPFTSSISAAAFQRPSCYEPLLPLGWSELTERLGFDPEWGQPLLHGGSEQLAAVYDLAGVRWIVPPPEPAAGDAAALEALLGRVQRRYAAGSGPLRDPRAQPGPPVENRDALPRAYWVASARRA